MKKLFLYLLALPLAFMSCSDASEDFIEEDQVFEKISYTSDHQQLQTYQTVVINSEKEYQDFVCKYIDDISNQTPQRSKVNFSNKSNNRLVRWLYCSENNQREGKRKRSLRIRRADFIIKKDSQSHNA